MFYFKKKNFFIVVFVLALLAGICWFIFAGPNSPKPAMPVAFVDYKNIAYEIEGKNILLSSGVSVTEVAPGSASKLTTRYFGNEATGDLNNDGTSDVAFVLAQDGGGSGTFYYVVVALKTPQGYIGTNAVLLGDRIAPQTTEIRDGELIVNYAERKSDEPMTQEPSVGVSKYLEIKNGKLVDVSQN